MDLASIAAHPLSWAATCCAAEPGLDGLLLFDVTDATLAQVAQALAEALATANPEPAARPRMVRLGSHEDEDGLWSGLRMRTADGHATLTPAPGPLVRGADDPPLVVTVPDLARLSLAASRAAIALLGSPVAQLQRHGRSEHWPTGTYWVAACATADVGQISEHLLDRFAVRLPASPAPLAPPAPPANSPPTVQALPRAWQEILRQARNKPPVEDSAIERAVALHDARHGMRRPLALLRLARATALLGGDPVVTAAHVDGVAALTGMITPEPPRTPPPPAAKPGTGPVSPRRRSGENQHAPGEDATDETVSEAAATEPVTEPVLMPEPSESAQTLPPITMATPVPRPYPEDTADADREAEPLRLPWQRAAGRPADRGPVVGTTPARRVADMAWFDTIRHAALYQHFRPRPARGGLLVTAADLRTHLRAARPERMLVLLLDHTCRHGWDWLPTLAPYLHRAYSERAAVCLVEVGADGAPSLLRAERAMLRSLLDPLVMVALTREPGRSTPLAHGLDLVGQSLRHALQHGAATLTGAQVVIVTDGLCNVPLEASLNGKITTPVAGTGVADALEAAQALRALDGVRVVVVRPPRVPHPEILLRFVDAVSRERALVVAGGT